MYASVMYVLSGSCLRMAVDLFCMHVYAKDNDTFVCTRTYRCLQNEALVALVIYRRYPSTTMGAVWLGFYQFSAKTIHYSAGKPIFRKFDPKFGSACVSVKFVQTKNVFQLLCVVVKFNSSECVIIFTVSPSPPMLAEVRLTH